MKHITVAIKAAVAAMVLVPGAALAAPDFSGSWVRDTAASTVPVYPTSWIVRGVPSGFGNNNAYVVEVRQSPGSVQVTDPTHPQRTYMLDGQTHTMTTDTMKAQASVTAKMEGDALSVSTVQPFSGLPGSVPLRAQETWSLSPDGKVLTILTVRNSPALRQTYVEVFNRR